MTCALTWWRISSDFCGQITWLRVSSHFRQLSVISQIQIVCLRNVIKAWLPCLYEDDSRSFRSCDWRRIEEEGVWPESWLVRCLFLPLLVSVAGLFVFPNQIDNRQKNTTFSRTISGLTNKFWVSQRCAREPSVFTAPSPRPFPSLHNFERLFHWKLLTKTILELTNFRVFESLSPHQPTLVLTLHRPLLARSFDPVAKKSPCDFELTPENLLDWVCSQRAAKLHLCLRQAVFVTFHFFLFAFLQAYRRFLRQSSCCWILSDASTSIIICSTHCCGPRVWEASNFKLSSKRCVLILH